MGVQDFVRLHSTLADGKLVANGLLKIKEKSDCVLINSDGRHPTAPETSSVNAQ